MPLVMERDFCDIATTSHSVGYVLLKNWNSRCELRCYSREELARVAGFTAASGEEKAGSESSLLVVLARNCPRNCRLSATSQAVEPKNTLLIAPLSPAVYILEKFNAGILKTGWLVLLLVGVERGFSYLW